MALLVVFASVAVHAAFQARRRKHLDLAEQWLAANLVFLHRRAPTDFEGRLVS
jgi:hypothetical protein